MRHFVKAVAFRKFSIPSLYQIHFKSDQIFMALSMKYTVRYNNTLILQCHYQCVGGGGGLKVWSGSFWRKIKAFRLYPTVYFIGSAIKSIVAFKYLIKPRIVELYLDFILLIVREVFVVKHIHIDSRGLAQLYFSINLKKLPWKD